MLAQKVTCIFVGCSVLDQSTASKFPPPRPPPKTFQVQSGKQPVSPHSVSKRTVCAPICFDLCCFSILGYIHCCFLFLCSSLVSQSQLLYVATIAVFYSDVSLLCHSYFKKQLPLQTLFCLMQHYYGTITLISDTPNLNYLLGM